MPTLRFEGRDVRYEPDDTIASALYRRGVRTFTRSFKYHRPRGLYCLSGDCPNCLVTVDGVPGVRACATPARSCEVRREGGIPSIGFDLLSVLRHAHRFLPVGFYYKTFIRPRWAWPLVERIVVRSTGIGTLPLSRTPDPRPAEHASPDVLVIGGGVAGLSAALTAAGEGASVVVCDEGSIGGRVFDRGLAERIDTLSSQVRAAGVEVWERATAIGVYEGPLVPIQRERVTILAHPRRVIVATGATDRHEVFEGNDLPGVWQGRAAGRLVARHGLTPGRRAVVVAGSTEAPSLVQALADAGIEIVAVIAADPGQPLPANAPTIHGQVVRVHGRRAVKAITVRTEQGTRRLRCDAVIVSTATVARDVLLRMASDDAVVGAGEVLRPGCDADAAAASGRAAALGEAGVQDAGDVLTPPSSGIVCLCEDVMVDDLLRAGREGFDNSELLKRYSTLSMGPCQGVQCGRYVTCFSTDPSGATSGPRTTARPPARTVPLEALAGLTPDVITRRTALHDTHLALGARMGPSGAWERPLNYGNAAEEYRAVRQRVSIMDVATLGKFLIGGPDADAFIDHLVPSTTANLKPGRARYVLILNETGYVIDDGMLIAPGGGLYQMTTTTGGADRMAAWLEHVAERTGAEVHIVDQTAARGAVVVAGPRARDLLERLTDDDIGASTLPYMARREIVVAGIPCEAIRVGFVGELAFELHHRRDQGPALWAALMQEGERFGLIPHGLDTLDLLRLEKGHVYIGQDTMPDDTPRKLGLGAMIDMSKPDFVGKTALARLDALPQGRGLSGLTFDSSDPADLMGQPIHRGDEIVGRVTSCGRSPALDLVIGLGWLRHGIDDALPLRVDGVRVRPSSTPFLDPEGARVRT